MAMMNVTSPRTNDASGSFEDAATQVLRELRSSVGTVIGHLPDAGQIRKPADLQRHLQLDSKLAWQIHRLAFAGDLSAGGASIPKIPAMQRFLKAAEQQGIDEAVIAEARRLLDRLDELITVHAGDFASFVSMLAGLSKNGLDHVDLSHRRAAFRAHSHLWGVQVRAQLWSTLYCPGSSPNVIDCASIRGLRDIRRLRAGVPFRLAGHRLTDARKHVTELHPVDDNSIQSPAGPSILLEFCTQPCPELEHRVHEGNVDTYLRETPIGNRGVQTLYLADVTRGVEWCTSDNMPNHLNNNVANTKPAEAMILDTLIHRNMFGSLQPTVKVFGSLERLGESDPEMFASEETLPIHVEVRNLGTGLAALPTPHIPRYAAMVETVCHRLGWNPDDFELFRCIIEYPVLGSVVNVRFPLPSTSNW